MLEALNMTLPGVPCVYQGDEYAEVGGNDPDNRHMLRFENLSEDELQVREQIASFARGRRRSMPLLYGDFIPVVSEPDLIVYKRIYLGEVVTVTIDRKKLSWDIVYSKL